MLSLIWLLFLVFNPQLATAFLAPLQLAQLLFRPRQPFFLPLAPSAPFAFFPPPPFGYPFYQPPPQFILPPPAPYGLPYFSPPPPFGLPFFPQPGPLPLFPPFAPPQPVFMPPNASVALSVAAFFRNLFARKLDTIAPESLSFPVSVPRNIKVPMPAYRPMPIPLERRSAIQHIHQVESQRHFDSPPPIRYVGMEPAPIKGDW